MRLSVGRGEDWVTKLQVPEGSSVTFFCICIFASLRLCIFVFLYLCSEQWLSHQTASARGLRTMLMTSDSALRCAALHSITFYPRALQSVTYITFYHSLRYIAFQCSALWFPGFKRFSLEWNNAGLAIPILDALASLEVGPVISCLADSKKMSGPCSQSQCSQSALSTQILKPFQNF